MSLTSEYLEIDLRIEDLDSQQSLNLYAHLMDGSIIIFQNVRSNPFRYLGYWTIDNEFSSQGVNSYVPAESIKFFSSVVCG